MSAIEPDLQLHLYRSQCIDAFVSVEKAIIALCRKLSPGHDGEILSQRTKRLRGVPASSTYSKAQRTQLHAALDELEGLLPIRNDIVHGGLTTFRMDQQQVAAFVNVRNATSIAPSARLFTSEHLQKVIQMTCGLAAQLDNILTKASSQT